MPKGRRKTLNVKGMDTYVKENYNLSREQVTLFTQMCNDPNVTLQPEFVFKGKRTRTILHPPIGAKYNWAPNGSYRLQQMLHCRPAGRTYSPARMRNSR